MKKRYNIDIPLVGLRSGIDNTMHTTDVEFFEDGACGSRPVFNPFTEPTTPSQAINFDIIGNDLVVGEKGGIRVYNGTKPGLYGNPAVTEGFYPISAACDIFDFAMFRNTVIIGGRIGPMVVWNTRDKTFRKANCFYRVGSPVLECMTLANHRGILFVGNTTEDGRGYPNRLRWGRISDPENMDAFENNTWTSFQDIGDADDEIVRLVPFENNLFIFKRHSIWIAVGLADTIVAPQTIRAINQEIGLVSHNGILVNDNEMIGLTNMGPVKITADGTLKSFAQELSEFWRKYEPGEWNQAFVTHNHLAETILIGIPSLESGEDGRNVTDTFAFRNEKWSMWKDYDVTMIKNHEYQNRNRLITTRTVAPYLGVLEYGPSNSDGTGTILPDFAPTFDTGPVKCGPCAPRAVQLMMENLGAAGSVTVEVFYDNSSVAYKTFTVTAANTPPDQQLDAIPLDETGFTASAKVIKPYFVDLDGKLYEFVRFRIMGRAATSSSNTDFVNFRLFQLKFSFQKRGPLF